MHSFIDKEFDTIRPTIILTFNYLGTILQVTHWHSPRFHAYYPTANSYPAIVADILSDAIGVIGFTWVKMDVPALITSICLHKNKQLYLLLKTGCNLYNFASKRKNLRGSLFFFKFHYAKMIKT